VPPNQQWHQVLSQTAHAQQPARRPPAQRACQQPPPQMDRRALAAAAVAAPAAGGGAAGTRAPQRGTQQLGHPRCRHRRRSLTPPPACLHSPPQHCPLPLAVHPVQHRRHCKQSQRQCHRGRRNRRQRQRRPRGRASWGAPACSPARCASGCLPRHNFVGGSCLFMLSAGAHHDSTR
jgi:hypothetical protein